MLKNLYIQNVVLIDKIDLTINNGLNVVTGETGAGKSIILDAISLLLGERSDANVIRQGCEQATIIGVFDASSFSKTHPLFSLLNELGIDYCNELLIKRVISTQKSRCFVNDQPTSIQTIKSISEHLVEIHNQFDYSFSQKHQRSLLDLFCNKAIQEFHQTLITTKSNFDEWKNFEDTLQKKQQILFESTFKKRQFEEIIKDLLPLNIQPLEESQLLSEREEFSNFGKIQAPLEEALQNLTSPHDITKTLFNAVRNLQRFDDILPSHIKTIVQSLDTIGTDLQEYIHQIQDFLAQHNSGIKRLQEIDERLYLLRGLAKKYIIDPNELHKHLKDAEEAINTIEHGEHDITLAEEACKQALIQYLESASKLHTQRLEGSKKLTDQVMMHLPELKMPLAKFCVHTQQTEQYAAHGFDNIQFEVAMNPGQAFSPLDKTASGGELSRLKLALRLVLADVKASSCVIFDEIDTGVSGAVASAIGQKLKSLSKEMQVICITHSAQVAAHGDYHYVVMKESDTTSTSTHIKLVTNDERVHEVAKLISGNQVTASSTDTAIEMINASNSR